MLTPEQIEKSKAWVVGPYELGILNNGYFTGLGEGSWLKKRKEIKDPAVCAALNRKLAAALRAAADKLDPPKEDGSNPCWYCGNDGEEKEIGSYCPCCN